MSVASVLEVVSRDTPLFIAQDASDPLSSRQVCWLESLSSRVCVLKDHELFHLGMSGLEQSHRLCQIHQRVASLSGSMYTTKIDSDCLMFADTLTPLLATNRFVLVGSWAEWGSWGAYCSYSHRVWERLSGMSLQYYQMLLESSSERPGNYDEDHIHPRLVSSLWPADSILLRKPDWKAGWFDAYQFGQQASRSAVNLVELRKKIDFFDVVEFGRRSHMDHLDLRNLGEKIALQEFCMLQALKLKRSVSSTSFWSEQENS